MVSEIRFFKRRRRRTWTICENYVYLYFTPPVIFSSIFLHAVTFSHVLHLDVLRRQIELKLKVIIEISLCMAIMQNHPFPYIHSTTVLCDSNSVRINQQMPTNVSIYLRIIISKSCHSMTAIGHAKHFIHRQFTKSLFTFPLTNTLIYTRQK